MRFKLKFGQAEVEAAGARGELSERHETEEEETRTGGEKM